MAHEVAHMEAQMVAHTVAYRVVDREDNKAAAMAVEMDEGKMVER
jgi:hypothetical protein